MDDSKESKIAEIKKALTVELFQNGTPQDLGAVDAVAKSVLKRFYPGSIPDVKCCFETPEDEKRGTVTIAYVHVEPININTTPISFVNTPHNSQH